MSLIAGWLQLIALAAYSAWQQLASAAGAQLERLCWPQTRCPPCMHSSMHATYSRGPKHPCPLILCAGDLVPGKARGVPTSMPATGGLQQTRSSDAMP